MKKIIILLIVLIFFFSLWFNSALAKDCGKGMHYENGECKRMLEIVYPIFGDKDSYVPKTIGTGLPEYVEYIFRFSIGIVGFIIFGIFLWAGIDYLFFCVGNPGKLMEALDRIKSAGLGALILLCSFIIFNTINPQLTTLKLEKMKSLPGIVSPGVYICNYHYEGEKENELGTILNDYIYQEDTDKQIEAAKKLKNVMINPKGNCYRINFSGNLEGFTINKTTKNTIFFVPTVTLDPENPKKREAKYEYGIILHEKDNFRGQCIEPVENDTLYKQNFPNFQVENSLLLFTVKSVTLFKEPSNVPDTATGITLFSCFDYNKSDNFCPKDIAMKSSNPFKPSNSIVEHIKSEVLKNQGFYENIRSVRIDTQGSYFAIVYDNISNKIRNCAILKNNDPDLTNLPSLKTGCGQGCNRVWEFIIGAKLKSCVPCIRSMTVYKGQIL